MTASNWKLAVPLLLTVGSAQAAGCIKGAAVGGVAGHVAGKHGLMGAAAGCAIGHHKAAKAEKAQKAAAQTPAMKVSH